MANDSVVVARRTGRVKVVMEWEVDAQMETTEGPNGFQCVDWIAAYNALILQCTPGTARSLSITNLGAGEEVTEGE